MPGPTGASVAEFVQGWTEFAADLPEGARRFAIRSCAEGAMMLMLDDVTFIPADGYFSGLALQGYNVYRDGVRLNADMVNDTSYTDTDAPSGKSCVYHVTAVFDGHGESAPSDPVSVRTSAVEHAVTVGSERPVYYNLQGVMVDGQLTPGIYVRKTGSASEKIIVK